MGKCVPRITGAGFGPGRGVDVGVWMDGGGNPVPECMIFTKT